MDMGFGKFSQEFRVFVEIEYEKYGNLGILKEPIGIT